MREQSEESGNCYEEFERRTRSISENCEENTDKLKRTATSVVCFALNLN